VRDTAARELAAADSRVYEFSVTTFPLGGPSLVLLIASRTRVSDAESATAYLTRCRQIPDYLDQHAVRLRTAARDGFTPVAPLVSDAIRQLNDHLSHPERDPMLTCRPPEGWAGTPVWREEVTKGYPDTMRNSPGCSSCRTCPCCSARFTSCRTARAGACTPNGWPTSSACTPTTSSGSACSAAPPFVPSGSSSTADCTRAAGAGRGPGSSRWRTRPCPRTSSTPKSTATSRCPARRWVYLVGQREILRLRDEARARLGAAFDIRDFHSAVLDHGSVPLPVLGQVVTEWAASVDATD